jgi:hypothetical protein
MQSAVQLSPATYAALIDRMSPAPRPADDPQLIHDIGDQEQLDPDTLPAPRVITATSYFRCWRPRQ